MNEERSFAYVIASCARTDDIHQEIRTQWSTGCGDVLESILSLEECVDTSHDIWCGDWRLWMDRIAPLQFTLGWDAREYLLDLFHHAGVPPTYQTEIYGDEYDSQIIYFNQLPSPQSIDLAINSTSVEYLSRSVDRTRFDEVLKATLNLAISQERGFLFIWGWGFDYYRNEKYLSFKEVREGLEKYGFKFFTRHA